jgi:hypothetical protein
MLDFQRVNLYCMPEPICPRHHGILGWSPFRGVGFIHKNWVIVAFGVCGYASEIYTRT